jgi:serine/threonine protein kinase
MAVDTVNTLIDALRQFGILDDHQLALIEREAAQQFEEPRQLARELITRGWLTKYQAKQLLLGHGSELTLGAYRLLERLGSGGMGQVFKALHVPMNRYVALKIVRPELVADAKTLKRFRREVQAVAQLSHPNIVTVFDASQVGDTHFLAMEYIDGLDLSALVRDSAPLPVDVACDYIRQAALGLQHANERGLIHRDVKPGNLLITRNPPGVVKILDMGLARPVRIDGGENLKAQSALTIDGSVVGTPDFMSPEQAKNSSTVDKRADYYSLGCTFYYCLTARMPFPVKNVMEKLIKHQMEQPYPAELVRGEIPAAVCAILQKMMAKKADDRYQNADEIAAALTPFCRGTAASAAVVDAVPVTEEIVPSGVSTPLPASDTSPFNFGPPPPKAEIAAPKPNRAQARLMLALCGLAAGFLLSIILVVAIVAGASEKKSASSEATQPAPPQSTVPTKPEPPALRYEDKLLLDCIPDRAAFVAVVNIRQLMNAKAVDAHFDPTLKPIFANIEQLNINPRTQFDRVVVSIVPGSPDRFVAVLLGNYMSAEANDFFHRQFKLESRRVGEGAELPVGTIETEGGRKESVAIVRRSFLAVASDLTLLREVDQRLRETNRPANERMLKYLSGSKPETAIRFLLFGSYVVNEEPLESAGIHDLTGDILVSDRVELDAVAHVRDAKQFRERLRTVGSTFATGALFDPRLAIPAALLRSPRIETVTSVNPQTTELRIKNSIPPRELDIILKAVVKRFGLTP